MWRGRRRAQESAVQQLRRRASSGRSTPCWPPQPEHHQCAAARAAATIPASAASPRARACVCACVRCGGGRSGPGTARGCWPSSRTGERAAASGGAGRVAGPLGVAGRQNVATPAGSRVAKKMTGLLFESKNHRLHRNIGL